MTQTEIVTSNMNPDTSELVNDEIVADFDGPSVAGLDSVVLPWPSLLRFIRRIRHGTD
jgi:hypothetical protein